MPPPRPKRNARVALSTDMYESISKEGSASLHRVSELKEKFHVWITSQMEYNKQQLQKTCTTAATSQEIRSPAHKKLKATTTTTEKTQLPDEVIRDVKKQIRAMKKAELERELRQRNLDAKGLKKALQDRLWAVMKKELLSGAMNESKEEQGPFENEDELAKAQPVAPPEPSAEKESRQSVIMIDIEEAVSTEVPDKEEAMRISLEDEKKETGVKAAVVESANNVVGNAFETHTTSENVQPPDANAKALSPKRSLSPMKQSVKQVAKMFSGDKSPRPMYSPAKPGRSPWLKSSDKSEGYDSKGQDTQESKEEVGVAAENRPLQFAKAPETGSLSGGSFSAKSTNSALKSKLAKEKTKERMDKIRSHQKKALLNASKQQPHVTSGYITNLSSISNLASMSKNRSANDGNSRLIDQMRAKTAAAGGASESVKPGKLNMPNRVAMAVKSAEMKLNSMALAPPSSGVKTKQPDILSPMSTYELSDREESDSDYESEDDSSYAKSNKKTIPSWAAKDKLAPKLEAQFKLGGVDPDEIFGEVETCDLEEIFDRRKTRYIKRSSSGNWCRDRATRAEKNAYRRNMQYLGGGTV